MDREVRRELANQLADADVLHDGGIDSCADDRTQEVLGVFELVGKDQCVECYVAPHATLMQVSHEIGQVGLGEVLATHAGIEAIQAKENGIRAIFDGSARALPIPCRC